MDQQDSKKSYSVISGNSSNNSQAEIIGEKRPGLSITTPEEEKQMPLSETPRFDNKPHFPDVNAEFEAKYNKAEELLKYSIPNILSQAIDPKPLTELEKMLAELNKHCVDLSREKEMLELSKSKLKAVDQLKQEKLKLLDITLKKKSVVEDYMKKSSTKPDMLSSFEAKMAEIEQQAQDQQKNISDLENKEKAIEQQMNLVYLNAEQQVKKMLQSLNVLETESVFVVQKTIIQQMDKLEKQAQKLDICFLIDCTGSMDPYILNVKEKIKEIIEAVKQRFTSLAFRVAIVGYRDYFTEESLHKNDRFEILPFKEDVGAAIKFLDELEAVGGNDAAEDVNGGLQQAIYNVEWKSPTKTIVHIGDAPPHGTRFHNFDFENSKSYDDEYPNGIEGQDKPYEELFKEIKNRGINYVFLEVDEDTKTMIEEFKKIYDSVVEENPNTSFSWLSVGKDAKEMVKAITFSLNSSLSSSVSNTSKVLSQSQISAIKKPVTIKIQDDYPAEHGQGFDLLTKLNMYATNITQIESTVQVTSTILDDINDLRELEMNQFKLIKEHSRVAVLKEPFAASQTSLVYAAQFMPEKYNNWFKMVLKTPHQEREPDYYARALKKNILAVYLANQFNKALSQAGHPQDHKVIVPKVVAIARRSQYYLLEPLVFGLFEKYVNKNGTVNENVPLMSAFSHFSHDFTKGRYMVTDLKGVNNIICSPDIFSSEGEYHEFNDNGAIGMICFFRQHECNEYCRSLDLKIHEAQENRRHDLFNAQVSFSLVQDYTKCKAIYCNGKAVKDGLCENCLSNS